MALNQVAVIDKIEVLSVTGQIQVRQNNQIQDDTKNNEIIASSFERWVLNPGDDISAQDPKVQAIANTIWTPEVIAAYKASLQPITTIPASV
jgi:hypothetical protein